MDWKNMVNGIAAAAETNVKSQLRDDDYVGEDGVLHCGLCGKARQTKVHLFGEDRVVWCICDCRSKELKEQEDAKKRDKVELLRLDGFHDVTLAESRFDEDAAPESKESVACRNYVEHFDEFYREGKGLVFTGGVGTGKTFYASCIANALIEKLHTVLVTSVGRCVRDMEGDGRNDNVAYLQKFDLVVFDDLGVERNTPYMNELVYAVIDGRVRSGKPMIVTTNVMMDELKKTDGIGVESARIYDRILAHCIPIRFEGTNRRREQARDEYRHFKDLLGI